MVNTQNLTFGVIGLLIGLFVGILIGVAIERSKHIKDMSESQENMEKLFTELKNKLEIAEKLREEFNKNNLEQIKNIHQLINSIPSQLQQTLSNLRKDSEENTDKKLKTVKEDLSELFTNLKEHLHDFENNQDKNLRDSVQKIENNVKEIERNVNNMLRVLSGTKKRGNVGENVLKEVLSSFIAAGEVITNLQIKGGVVEFAWDLKDGKYIPIDSKMPDLFSLMEKYEKADNPEEAKSIKDEMKKRIKQQIKNVAKYKNLSNTIGHCILAIPDGIVQIIPEIINEGSKENVIISGYNLVTANALLLKTQYNIYKSSGDLGRYKEVLNNILDIFASISKNLSKIEKGVTMIRNASEDIRKHSDKATHMINVVHSGKSLQENRVSESSDPVEQKLQF